MTRLHPWKKPYVLWTILVKSGKVRYIGCSNMAAWQLMKALAYSEYKELARFVSLQAYYTIAGRDLERELVPLLLDQKVGLMVWSPLAGGLLSGKYKRNGEGPEDARRVNFDFPPVNKERAFDILDVLHQMAEERCFSCTACIGLAAASASGKFRYYWCEESGAIRR